MADRHRAQPDRARGIYGAGEEAILLVVFGGIVAGSATIALRARPPRVLRILRDTIRTTAQTAVRLSVLVLASCGSRTTSASTSCSAPSPPA